MTTIRATIHGRRLELEVPADWPDGTQVEVYPLNQNALDPAAAMTSDEIAATLLAMDRVEPLEMTETECNLWDAERQASRERDKAQFVQHSDELRRVWE